MAVRRLSHPCGSRPLPSTREYTRSSTSSSHAAQRRDSAARLRGELPQHHPLRRRRPAGTAVVWRNVFVADVTPPETAHQRHARQEPHGPLITVAEEAIAVSGSQEQPHPALAAQLLHPRDGQGRSAPTTPSPRPASRRWTPRRPPRHRCASVGMNTRRTAPLPAAPDPTGSRSRSNCTALRAARWPASCWRWSAFRWESPRARAAESAGYVNAIFLGFFCYYLVVHRADRPGEAEDAAGAGGGLASECRVLRGRIDLPGPHGAARRPRPAGRTCAACFGGLASESLKGRMPAVRTPSAHPDAGACPLLPAVGRYLRPLHLSLLPGAGAGQLRVADAESTISSS